ncbi:unnamed protein product [Clonostachys solani]|uniref:Uncharacterized protein n=1 Tax=Clonostachys solani TaxID=160281 RepID=A0A9N9VZ29_9HYPO|nr:unnamed protein product [Clonostachys solani]
MEARKQSVPENCASSGPGNLGTVQGPVPGLNGPFEGLVGREQSPSLVRNPNGTSLIHFYQEAKLLTITFGPGFTCVSR